MILGINQNIQHWFPRDVKMSLLKKVDNVYESMLWLKKMMHISRWNYGNVMLSLTWQFHKYPSHFSVTLLIFLIKTTRNFNALKAVETLF